MSDARDKERSRRAWELAERQHGVVARRQLLEIGFSPKAIEHRVARGRLHLVTRGVYAVGWPRLTQERHWMGAVLVCGEGAALSHRSAAALWGVSRELAQRIDISVSRLCKVRRQGLRVRSRPTLAPTDIVIRDGIPVTAIARTLVDLASELIPLRVERAVNEADKQNLIDPERLRRALDKYAGEPGVRPLRNLLDKRTFRLSDSDLEIFFRPIAAAAGLATPQSKQVLNGFEVDFFFSDLGLIVETDGLRYHRTPSTQTRDAQRDRAHVLAGMTPIRFTHYEIRYEPTAVSRALTSAAELLRKRKGL